MHVKAENFLSSSFRGESLQVCEMHIESREMFCEIAGNGSFLFGFAFFEFSLTLHFLINK